MKILAIGDQHFRFELPYSSAISDGRRSEWNDVKSVILDEAKDCDAVVLLGDGLNQRHNHSSVIREFIDFLDAFGDKEVHILVGNHERYGTSTALDFIQSVKHDKWFVYKEPTVTKVAGIDSMMIPFMTPALLGVETKEEGIRAIVDKFPTDKIPLAFAHHGVSGGLIRGMGMEMFNEIILPGDVMRDKFGHTFAGHIHEGQVMYPIFMTGSVFTHEIGEHEKSIWKYDEVTVSRIPLPVRGIYKAEWGVTDLEKIPDHSIVKCYVTVRETDIDEVRKALSRFDAGIVVEQYPSERTKVHFEEGGLDLSVENLLKIYAEARGLPIEDVLSGYELIK